MESGDPSLVTTIQDVLDEHVLSTSLDYDAQFELPVECNSAIGLVSVGEAILRFLDSLLQPIIPYAFFRSCLDQGANSKEEAWQIFAQLPPVHQEVFQYICHYINHIHLPRCPPHFKAAVIGMCFFLQV